MAKARIAIVPVTPFQQNCTILVCEETGEAAPWWTPAATSTRIRDAHRADRLTVEEDPDHARPHRPRRRRRRARGRGLGVPVEGPHLDDKPLLDRLAATGLAYGIAGARER